MYDAWAAYDEVAEPVLLGHTLGGYTAEFDGISEFILPFLDIPVARQEAVSYAAYRILTHRYTNSRVSSPLKPVLTPCSPPWAMTLP